jgi:NitT/TauT family transport system substrate-binding protein
MLFGSSSFNVSAAEILRVGALKYGTVNWELEVIKRHNLDRKHGFEMAIVELGSAQATVVALQGGRVDLVVNDWVWVNKQKNSRRDYAYSPYSTAIGGLVVSPEANVHSLMDLRGKRIGVAGGPVDKGWLLFRAYGKKVLGVDLKEVNDIKFASPPLLNHLLLSGELDAVINDWHYNARLIAAGMQTLLSTEELLAVFGIDKKVPMLGWVFDRERAERRPIVMNAFFNASFEAKAILARSDTEWDAIRPLLKADSDAVFSALKAAYRAGIPQPLSRDDALAIRAIYDILYPSSVVGLVGAAGATNMMSTTSTEPNRNDKNKNFDEGMFWWQFMRRQES